MNFAGFLELHARSNPDGLAVADHRVRLGFAALDVACSQLAHSLQARGLQKGDRVAILSLNRVEVAITLLACMKAGFVPVPLNWRLHGQDLARVVTHAAPSCLVAPVSRLSDIAPAYSGPILELGEAPRTGSFWTALERQPSHYPSVGCQNDAIATLLYTSGTTSTPKAAIHTHGMRIAIAGAMAQSFSLSRQDIALAVSPIFHTSGMSVLCNAIFVGCPCIMMEHWDLAAFIRTVHQERITFLHLIATLIVDIASAPAAMFENMESRVRFLWGGGHNVDEALLRRFEDRFGCTLLIGYSRTEGGLAYNPLDQDRRSFAHNGYGNANSSDLRIFDPDGNPLPAGEIGEIAVRGDGVTPGYWDGDYLRRPRQIDGNWQATGDRGVLAPDGALTFLGRMDDMIKSGGENVYPAEVAAALLRVPGVADAVVFGLPHPRLGQTVAALIVRRDPGLDALTVQDGCRAELGGFKLPRVIGFVDEFPRLGSQKVDYAACRIIASGLLAVPGELAPTL